MSPAFDPRAPRSTVLFLADLLTGNAILLKNTLVET